MKSLVQKLVDIPAPPGYETQIRQAIRQEIEKTTKDVRVDPLGNLIAPVGVQSSSGKKVMLVAHMDEIGLMATHIDDNGYVRFTTVGWVASLYSVTGRVRFLNGARGVIGAERPQETHHVPPLDRLFIDTGATDRKSSPVKVGDVAVFEQPFSEMGSRWVSKAMDDRIGVAILLETLRQLRKTPHQVVFVFSVQEEVGLRGATTAAFGVDPDIGLAVDVTDTGDTPNGYRMEVSLGRGPAIKVRDGGMLADRNVVDWMTRSAERAGLPYQLEVLTTGTTDARAVQTARGGVPTGCLSVPCRYIHTQSEMVDYNDVQACVRLLVEILSRPVELSND
ncbi:MAG: M42 family metallopeptidase [Anaerolineales bacterium]|nr:M42 family metallopeptidase [Anaerolineales bacterium]